MRLDRDLPHDEIIGLPGVKYMQGNQYFGIDGTPLVFEDGAARPARPDELPEPVARAVVADDVDYSSKPTAELKAMLKVYGHEWHNREDAIAFLQDNA